MWHASLVAGGVRRVEREFGQKSFAARVAGRDLRDLRKLYEVALADGGILVDAALFLPHPTQARADVDGVT